MGELTRQSVVGLAARERASKLPEWTAREGGENKWIKPTRTHLSLTILFVRNTSARGEWTRPKDQAEEKPGKLAGRGQWLLMGAPVRGVWLRSSCCGSVRRSDAMQAEQSQSEGSRQSDRATHVLQIAGAVNSPGGLHLWGPQARRADMQPGILGCWDRIRGFSVRGQRRGSSASSCRTKTRRKCQ